MRHRIGQPLRRAGVVVFALAICVCRAAVAAAQSAAAPTAVTPAQAAPFLGDWSVPADGQQGPVTFLLTLKVTDGKVGAEISSDRTPGKQAITDISKTGETLTLKYALDYQGMPVPVVVTLTPTAETLKVTLDFAGGAYTVSGIGTKKK